MKESEVFDIEKIEEVIELLEQQQIVTFDTVTAFEVIKRKILNEDEISSFVRNGLGVVYDAEFSHYSLNEFKKSVEYNFSYYEGTKDKPFDLNKLRELIDYCERMGQRYQYGIIYPDSQVLISRTINRYEFDLVKQKVLEILASFQNNLFGKKIQNVPDIMMRLHGNSRGEIEILFNDLKEVYVSFYFDRYLKTNQDSTVLSRYH